MVKRLRHSTSTTCHRSAPRSHTSRSEEGLEQYAQPYFARAAWRGHGRGTALPLPFPGGSRRGRNRVLPKRRDLVHERRDCSRHPSGGCPMKAHVPDCLMPFADTPAWVAWNPERRNGEMRKVPKCPSTGAKEPSRNKRF